MPRFNVKLQNGDFKAEARLHYGANAQEVEEAMKGTLGGEASPFKVSAYEDDHEYFIVALLETVENVQHKVPTGKYYGPFFCREDAEAWTKMKDHALDDDHMKDRYRYDIIQLGC